MTDPIPPDLNERLISARRREDAALRTEVQFEDFVKRYENDQKETSKWRQQYDGRLQAIEGKTEILDTLRTPGKIFGGAIAIAATPILGILGYDLGKHFSEWLARVLK